MLKINWTDSVRVAFYIRVSTEEQNKDGYGPEMQMHWLEDMITYREKVSGWTHKKEWEYKDLGCTGADLNRPAFKRMMQDAKDGKFDMIAVWKIDRLSRNLSHLLATFETLQTYKVGFFSLKENIDFTGPIGKLTFQIFGALAEFEREMIKTRTSEGKRASARLGNYVLNKTPFGYKKEDLEKKRGRSLDTVESEAAWVVRIFEEFISGKSLEQIAKTLNENRVLKNEANLKKDRVTRWYGSTIRAILENPVYTGRAVYNSKGETGEVESIEIPTPRLVSDLTFELAQNRLESLESDAKRGGGNREYLLSRKIVDLETGRKFVGVSRSRDGKTNYRRKAFAFEWKTYKNRDIPGEPLEKLVWETVHKMIDRPEELFETFKKQSIDSREYDGYSVERDRNARELEKLDRQETAIEMDYYDGKHTEEKKEKLVGNISQKKGQLIARNEELDKKMDAILKAEETRSALEKFTKDFTTSLENLTFEQKKFLVDLLVETIEVTTVSSQLNLNIKLRFDQSKVERNEAGYEPKNPSDKPKGGSSEGSSSIYGATDWARTSDLLLRREAL